MLYLIREGSEIEISLHKKQANTKPQNKHILYVDYGKHHVCVCVADNIVTIIVTA